MVWSYALAGNRKSLWRNALYQGIIQNWLYFPLETMLPKEQSFLHQENAGFRQKLVKASYLEEAIPVISSSFFAAETNEKSFLYEKLPIC